MKYIVTVRGMLKGTPEQAKLLHNEIVAKTSSISKSMGNVAHHPHLNVQNGKEFFSIDTWDNLENIQKLYSDPNLAAEFGKLFEGMPDIAIWSEAGIPAEEGALDSSMALLDFQTETTITTTVTTDTKEGDLIALWMF